MRKNNRVSSFLAAAVAAATLVFGTASHAQIAGTGNLNVSQLSNYQNECAIIGNPNNNSELFSLCNNATGGLFAARSIDLGATWTSPWDASKTIANGTVGTAACCDPSLAWDSFGNLFVTYVDSTLTNVVTLLSVDDGLTFSVLSTFGPEGVDQPTVTVGPGAPGSPPGSSQVWIVFSVSGNMVARGATVTGLGTVGAFSAQQSIPGASGCSYGDVSIAPNGTVVQVCEGPSNTSGPASLLVNTNPTGVGGSFGAAVNAVSTNVGGFDFITPQSRRSVDAEAGFAFDRDPSSPNFGRLYLVYTDSPSVGSNDTNIKLLYSTDSGATWPFPAVQVSSVPGHSQFLPRIASNPLSGNIGVCWHDTRNSAANTSMEEFCTIAAPTPSMTGAPSFLADGQIGAALSDGNGSNPPVAGQADIQFGDYSGLEYNYTPGVGQIGGLHPIWADDSNSTGNNPDGTSRYDAYTDKVTGGPAVNEGDPHITTVDGNHYNFQSAGEFVSLFDYAGMEIQTRQTPVSTASPWYDSYTGLTTCVSVNSAVAARLGKHRVTYQPGSGGGPNSNPMQLRVDGVVTALPANGLTLGTDGRVVNAPAGDGIEIDFADGTTLTATGAWWGAPQNVWYLSVQVYHSPGLNGIMGAMARGSWLPSLSNGASVGAMPAGVTPAALHQKFLTLNQTYANSWRVTDRTSLFDYARGTSTATFTISGWPAESGTCTLPNIPPAKPLDPQRAIEICQAIEDKTRNANCIFDATATGQEGFAKAYLAAQKIQTGGTVTVLTLTIPPLNKLNRIPVPIITVKVSRLAGAGRVPTGSVQILVDGERVGDPIRLDDKGSATWNLDAGKLGGRIVSARYVPEKDGVFLPSTSAEVRVAVAGRD